MFTKKKMLAGFLTLAMLLSLMTGMAVPAGAATGDAQPPELSMWSPTDVTITGVDGQEYVIIPRYTEPDWSKAVEPKDGFVTFEDLTPATAYTILTRIKGGSDEPAAKEFTTDLIGIGVFSEDDYVVGAVIQGQIDPEDAQGLAYQWYYDTITVNEEGVEFHDYFPINGTGEKNYTIQAADVGKYLAFKAFMDEVEVGVIDSIGPVLAEAAPSAPAGNTPCPKDDTCPISQFTDARPDAWYHDGVHWALETGTMNGVGNDKFAPNGTATRAMVVTMLWRLEGEPEAKAPAFTDVSDGSWYQQSVGWAAENGIVTGTSATTFAPNASVTREQLVTILYRYAQYKELDVSVGEDTNILSYDDAFNISSWAMPAFQWACGAEIVSGVSQSALGPKNDATRAQIATLFQRFCENQSEAARETASNVFDFDGNQVQVTVDISGGWEVEFGEMSTYLYDRPAEDPDNDTREAAAYGVYDTQEDYDAFLAEAKSSDGFTQTDNGFTYTDSIGVTHFFRDLGNGVYYRVMVNPGYDPQETFDRFAVEMLEAAAVN